MTESNNSITLYLYYLYLQYTYIHYLNTFQCWSLKDGDDEKESTNGTWLYALNEYPLFDGMTIAVETQLLEITFDA